MKSPFNFATGYYLLVEKPTDRMFNSSKVIDSKRIKYKNSGLRRSKTDRIHLNQPYWVIWNSVLWSPNERPRRGGRGWSLALKHFQKQAYIMIPFSEPRSSTRNKPILTVWLEPNQSNRTLITLHLPGTYYLYPCH